MTNADKRQLTNALKAIHGNVRDIATYLARPYIALDDVADMHQWASTALDSLATAVEGAREDARCDWRVFASLVWTRDDVGRTVEALRYCLQEQERTD